jgi:hypothetical protein
MNLHPGLVVCTYKHFAGSWNPALRISLNCGTIKEDDRFFPRDDWRPPSDEEFTLLTPDDGESDFSEKIQVFSIPERLHEEFWKLNLHTLTDQGDAAEDLTVEYSRFINHVADFLSFIDAPLPEHCSFRTVITAQELPSTAYDPNSKRYHGLHLNLQSDLPSSTCASAINMGDVARSLVWFNLDPRSMLVMLEGDAARNDPDDPTYSQKIIEEFLTTFPDYPVIRLLLKPCEGYILPLNRVVHDGYTRGMKEPDFNLVIEPS